MRHLDDEVDFEDMTEKATEVYRCLHQTAKARVEIDRKCITIKRTLENINREKQYMNRLFQYLLQSGINEENYTILREHLKTIKSQLSSFNEHHFNREFPSTFQDFTKEFQIQPSKLRSIQSLLSDIARLEHQTADQTANLPTTLDGNDQTQNHFVFQV